MHSEPWEPSSIEQRAADIVAAVSRIRVYCADHVFEAFLEDDMRQDAVVRQLLIIAEACDSIPRLEDQQGTPPDRRLENRRADVPWRAIRSMGNRIRHVYGTIDPKVLWDVVALGHLDLIDEAIRSLFPDSMRVRLAPLIGRRRRGKGLSADEINAHMRELRGHDAFETRNS